MLRILKSSQKSEYQSGAEAEYFFFHHRFLGYFTAVIIMPVLIIMAVSLFTFILAFPLAFLLGCL